MRINKYLIGLSLFIIIICVLGLCFSNWWFWYNDEFTYLSSGKYAQTWSDLLYFFIDGDTHRYQTETQSFGTTFYRPINCIIATLEHWFFGTNALYYHLLDVAIHGFNAALIFLIAQNITSLFPALWAALMFAFHPLIAYEFGRVDCLHVYLSTTCILLCLILLASYLKKQSTVTYLLLCILFTFSLMNRETTAILPLFFTIAGLYFQKKPLITPWLILISFAGLRLFLLPVRTSTDTVLFSLEKITSILALWIQFLLQATYDFFALSWLPEGYPLARAVILSVCLGACLFAFLQSKNKSLLMLSTLSAYALLWPAFILGGYCMRYNYEAQPFFVFFLLGCWIALSKNQYLRTIVGSCVWMLIAFNIVLCVWCFKQREQHFIEVKQSFEHFCSNPQLKNHKLCFVKTPGRPFGNAIDKALNVFLEIPEKNVYYDEASCIHAPYLINKGFIRVPYFFPKNMNPKGLLHSIPQEILHQKPLFITWNFQSSAFQCAKLDVN